MIPTARALFLFALLASAPSLLFAQTASPPASPAPRFLKVSAPFAQKLVMQAKAAHPEIKKIGLHMVPPGETESCIIASPIESKIGKISSAADLTVITSGQPKVYPHPEEGGFFDLGLPLADARQRPLGLMVLEIPYSYAATKEQALTLGLKFCDEISSQIPDKSALFRPAP